MSSSGPLIPEKTILGKALNPARTFTKAVTPDSWDKYTNVLNEQALDFGGAFRDAAQLAAVNPGDPPILPDAPTAENSAPQMNAAAAAQRKAKGRASTILSSGTSSGGQSARRTLLGS